MAGKRKFTQEQVDQIRDAYLHWAVHDFQTKRVDELCSELGISKTRLYELRNSGWMLDSPVNKPAAEDNGDMAAAVRYLTQELVSAKVRVSQLSEILDAHGIQYPD